MNENKESLKQVGNHWLHSSTRGQIPVSFNDTLCIMLYFLIMVKTKVLLTKLSNSIKIVKV